MNLTTTYHNTMEVQSENDLPHNATAAENLKLQVEFSWSQFSSSIYQISDKSSLPIYKLSYRFTSPQLIFKSAENDSKIATGSLHAVSIHGDCDIRGRHVTLQPRKRLKTEYGYLSQAFSDGQELKSMTWTGSCGLKTWDFICLDPQQNAVAKATLNIWGLKKIAQIEFQTAAGSVTEEMRDEIVVTGITLIYIMSIRINNPLSLVGSAIAHPNRGVEHKNNQPAEQPQSTELQNMDVKKNA